MRILFIHQSFPAQFRYTAAVLARNPANEVVFLTAAAPGEIPGVRKVLFRPLTSDGPGVHHYLRHFQNAVLTGQAVYRQATALKREGFAPDIVFGHSGRGETLYMKDLFPAVPLACYFEWYYHAHGTSFGFNPAEPVTADNAAEIRTKNAAILMDLVSCEQGISPTYWQHSQFPREFQAKIAVMHDGVDGGFFAPGTGRGLVLPRAGLELDADAEIVTYVATGMEPLRGFPQFMAAASLLQQRRPRCHIVVVGEDRAEYGRPAPAGTTFREIALQADGFELARLHFTGRLPVAEYRRVLLASSAHVYLTYPFILSWSLLEAMSCGCAVVGSNTPPVAELVTDGENGLLVDFFAARQIAAAVERVLDDRALRKRLGEQARQTIMVRYDARKLLPRHLKWLEEVAGKQ